MLFKAFIFREWGSGAFLQIMDTTSIFWGMAYAWAFKGIVYFGDVHPPSFTKRKLQKANFTAAPLLPKDF